MITGFERFIAVFEADRHPADRFGMFTSSRISADLIVDGEFSPFSLPPILRSRLTSSGDTG